MIDDMDHRFALMIIVRVQSKPDVIMCLILIEESNNRSWNENDLLVQIDRAMFLDFENFKQPCRKYSKVIIGSMVLHI